MKSFKSHIQEAVHLTLGKWITPAHQLVLLDNDVVGVLHHEDTHTWTAMIKGSATAGFKPLGKFNNQTHALQAIQKHLEQVQAIAARKI